MLENDIIFVEEYTSREMAIIFVALSVINHLSNYLLSFLS